MVTNPVPNLNWPFRRLGERVSSAGARALRRVAGGSAVTRDLELRRRQMALRRRERERAGLRTAGPVIGYRGYRIWQDAEGWRTSADPESVFESQADAKAFVRSLKNPVRRKDRPTQVFGVELDPETLTPISQKVDLDRPGDYGADPIGGGMFRMVPSGDIVGLEERNRRLKNPTYEVVYQDGRHSMAGSLRKAKEYAEARTERTGEPVVVNLLKDGGRTRLRKFATLGGFPESREYVLEYEKHHGRANPSSELGAHLVEEKQPGWGPTFDISHWTRAARRAAEGIRYAQVYEPSRGKVLVEFPRHIRTAHVLEDLEEVRSREEGNPNPSPSPEHLAAAQVAAQQARTGRWGVEIDHPNRRKRLHVSRSESPADTFLATVQPIRRGMGSRAKWRDKVIQDRNLESEIQHFLATGRLR